MPNKINKLASIVSFLTIKRLNWSSFRTVPDEIQFPLSFKTEIDSDKSTAFYEHMMRTLLIAGPCAAEDENQIEETAKFIKSEGLVLGRLF